MTICEVLRARRSLYQPRNHRASGPQLIEHLEKADSVPSTNPHYNDDDQDQKGHFLPPQCATENLTSLCDYAHVGKR